MPNPPDVLRYVKLPDKLENGSFDEYGHKVGDGVPASLVLYSLPGDPPPWQCWGVFERALEPGQHGFLIFTNVPGQAVPGGAFTEWHPATSTPYFTEDRLMVLYSVQRSRGAARIIGRNDSGQAVAAAAGLLFVPPPPPKAATLAVADTPAAAGPAPPPASPAASQAPPAPSKVPPKANPGRRKK